MSVGQKHRKRSRPAVPEESLASERRVVLEQIVDVADPVVLFARSRALVHLRVFLGDGGSIYARHRVRRRMNSDGLPRVQDA